MYQPDPMWNTNRLLAQIKGMLVWCGVCLTILVLVQGCGILSSMSAKSAIEDLRLGGGIDLGR